MQLSFAEFRAAVAEELEVEAGRLEGDARLTEDLDLDSLDLFRLAVLVEGLVPADRAVTINEGILSGGLATVGSVYEAALALTAHAGMAEGAAT